MTDAIGWTLLGLAFALIVATRLAWGVMADVLWPLATVCASAGSALVAASETRRRVQVEERTRFTGLLQRVCDAPGADAWRREVA